MQTITEPIVAPWTRRPLMTSGLAEMCFSRPLGTTDIVHLCSSQQYSQPVLRPTHPAIGLQILLPIGKNYSFLLFLPVGRHRIVGVRSVRSRPIHLNNHVLIYMSSSTHHDMNSLIADQSSKPYSSTSSSSTISEVCSPIMGNSIINHLQYINLCSHPYFSLCYVDLCPGECLKRSVF